MSKQRILFSVLHVIYTIQVQLGGAEGASKGWPPCLAVIGDERHAANRSALGNALAEASAAAGLAACGIVAYMEKEMAMQDGIKLSLRSIGDMDTTQVCYHCRLHCDIVRRCVFLLYGWVTC